MHVSEEIIMDLYLVRILEKVDRLVCLRFEIGGRKLYKQITCDSHTVIHKNPNGWMKTSLLGTLLVRARQILTNP